MKNVSVHMSHIEHCDLEMFEGLLQLIVAFPSTQLEEISLQLSMWRFQEGQPRFDELSRVMRKVLGSVEIATYSYKKVRLELSGLYIES